MHLDLTLLGKSTLAWLLGLSFTEVGFFLKGLRDKILHLLLIALGIHQDVKEATRLTASAYLLLICKVAEPKTHVCKDGLSLLELLT